MPVMLERWNDDKMDALEGRVAGLAALLLERQQEIYELRREMWQELRELRRELQQIDRSLPLPRCG